MDIAIVYDSTTGTTAKAAGAMGKVMEELGHGVAACHGDVSKDGKPDSGNGDKERKLLGILDRAGKGFGLSIFVDGGKSYG